MIADKSMETEPFIIEREYNAPIELVWHAITQNDAMKKWYFNLEDFKPEVGFEFQFWGGKDEDQYLHRCKVTEVIPGKKIAYSWRYEGHEGNSIVTFELFPNGKKTRLKLTHAGLETFPKHDPNFARESFAQGWTFITGTSLKNYLESGQ